ncbi:hypothetical protein AJ79_03936 [Helicocarpus griseus UAMH5409]|uniref:Uncharacterized protein n=1 Tax=Helicocarpus griseus UAMH5409 TaxID=1447875 RepID=A0A2B7XVZ7_9EURO|nr:hypothetical protein AJ79_03936 [Helicocarpus griseus UAMH5409]
MKFSRVPIIAILSLSATITHAAEQTENLKFMDIIKTLAVSPDDFLHLGSDGVLRVYDQKFTVHDAAAFTPAQIKDYITTLSEARRGDLLTHLEGVDGHDVPEDKWLAPDDHIKSEAATMQAEISKKAGGPISKDPNPLKARQIFNCDVIFCQSGGVCLFNGCLFCTNGICR